MKPDNLHTLLQDSILTSKPLIHPHLVCPPNGSVEERVAIYTNGFYARLIDVLQSDYNTLAAFLGDNKFTQLCRKYIDNHPSFNYSLNFFGKAFSSFLKQTKPYLKKPYLAEIASFEWAEAQSIIAHDADLLCVSDLQSLPVDEWPERKFALHPSNTMIKMQWNSLTLIEAIRNQRPIPQAKKLKTPYYVLVWRRQREACYCKLKHLDYMVLNALNNRATFLEVCEQLSHNMPQDKVPTYLVQCLHTWLQGQLLVKDHALNELT